MDLHENLMYCAYLIKVNVRIIMIMMIRIMIIIKIIIMIIIMIIITIIITINNNGKISSRN